MLTDDFLAVVSAHHTERRVDILNDAVDVGDDHGLRRLFDCRTESGQLDLTLFKRGDFRGNAANADHLAAGVAPGKLNRDKVAVALGRFQHLFDLNDALFLHHFPVVGGELVRDRIGKQHLIGIADYLLAG